MLHFTVESAEVIVGETHPKDPSLSREADKIRQDVSSRIPKPNGGKRKPNITHLSDVGEMTALLNCVQSDDVIRIHGEGNEFGIGYSVSSQYDFTSPGLARHLNSVLTDIGRTDISGVTIDIRSCNSATTVKNHPDISKVFNKRKFKLGEHSFNFAKGLSIGLDLLGNTGVTVEGYTGKLNMQEDGRQTSCSATDNTTNKKGQITYKTNNLENAKARYLNGKEIEDNNIKLTTPRNADYSGRKKERNQKSTKRSYRTIL